MRPLVEVDDARNGIQRERPFLAGEVERDALREIRARERVGAAAQLFLRHLARAPDRARDTRRATRRAPPGCSRTTEHLVERRKTLGRLPRRKRRAVAVEEITHATTLVRAVLPRCFGPGMRACAHPARLRANLTAQTPAASSDVGARRLVTMTPSERASGRVAAGWAGIAAVAFGAGLGELAAAIISPPASPIGEHRLRSDRPRPTVGERSGDRPLRHARQDRAPRRHRRRARARRRGGGSARAAAAAVGTRHRPRARRRRRDRGDDSCQRERGRLAPLGHLRGSRRHRPRNRRASATGHADARKRRMPRLPIVAGSSSGAAAPRSSVRSRPSGRRPPAPAAEPRPSSATPSPCPRPR